MPFELSNYYHRCQLLLLCYCHLSNLLSFAVQCHGLLFIFLLFRKRDIQIEKNRYFVHHSSMKGNIHCYQIKQRISTVQYASEFMTPIKHHARTFVMIRVCCSSHMNMQQQHTRNDSRLLFFPHEHATATHEKTIHCRIMLALYQFIRWISHSTDLENVVH